MSTLRTFLCPQCGGALPASARWFAVTCRYCGANVVAQGVRAVARAELVAAAQRAFPPGLGDAAVGAHRYRVLESLHPGVDDGVLLAERCDAPLARRVLKLAGDPASLARRKREAAALAQLQAIDVPSALHFARRLPVSEGMHALHWQGRALHAQVLRMPPGLWGSLESVIALQPAGVDARHAVWIWRRMLELLGWLHAQGWVHGALSPAHALVEPAGHGVVLCGWQAARRPDPYALAHAAAEDLVRSAWIVRALLCGPTDAAPGTGASTPPPLAQLLEACSVPAGLPAQGAARIEQALVAAADAAFGRPRFVHFAPAAPRGILGD